MRRGGRAEREVSKDKVTYPLDEEGDNLNSYGEEKKRIYSVRCGFAGRWKFFLRGEKSREKVSVDREDQK